MFAERLKREIKDYEHFNENRTDGLIVHTDAFDDFMMWLQEKHQEEKKHETIIDLSNRPKIVTKGECYWPGKAILHD